jgi:toxin-antitoxin system PIN domain toxin
VRAVDTNVLVYAHRQELPLHEPARQRLTELAEGVATWGIPVFCIGEFVRVVTHRRIFSPPSSLDVALAVIDAIAQSPSLRILAPDGEYWTAFRTLASSAKASGNLAFNAQIAAVCASHGATLITADRDFSRFHLDVEIFGA